MLLLAAGRGRRFGGDRPKVFAACAGRTVLRRSLERLAATHAPREIVLAVDPADRSRYLAPELEELRRAGLDTVVDGGATRQESMRRALAAAAPDAALILVHDAARPLLPIAAARTAIARAAEVGAAALAIPAPDTLKRADGNGRVAATVDRAGLWLAQTPQVIRRQLLLEALGHAERTGFLGTDDVSLVEHLGAPVMLVRSTPTNLKITTPEDLELAAAIAAAEAAP